MINSEHRRGGKLANITRLLLRGDHVHGEHGEHLLGVGVRVRVRVRVRGYGKG